MKFLKLLLDELRIFHWIKNLLIFTPLFFAGHLLNYQSFSLTFLLFLAFSFLSSAVYVINDIFDREKDRLHPVKKNRPIAAGKISVKAGLMVLLILLSLVGYLSFYFNLKVNIIIGIYLILNLAYSYHLKHLPVLDIFLVAIMFFLRIKVGGELLAIDLSNWLILVVFFLALFFVIGKRRSEYKVLMANNECVTRSVLVNYNEVFLDHILTISVVGVLLSYSLYAIEATTPYLLYSSFFVFFGLFRYLYLIYIFQEGQSPERLIFSDRWLCATMIFWLIYISFVFYY